MSEIEAYPLYTKAVAEDKVVEFNQVQTLCISQWQANKNTSVERACLLASVLRTNQNKTAAAATTTTITTTTNNNNKQEVSIGFELSNNMHMYYAFDNLICMFSCMTSYIPLVWQTYFLFFL